MKSFNRRKIICRAALIALIILMIPTVAISILCIDIGTSLTHRKKEIEAAISFAGDRFNYEKVSFKSKTDNLNLKGVFFPSGTPSNKTVILVHGFGENLLMKGRLEILVGFLVPRGYNLLAFDLRGHGSSEGDMISFGYNEKYDVIGAVDYIKSRGKIGDKIALLGFSMGAVSVIEAAGMDDRVDAVIADSPFMDLRHFIAEDIPSLPEDLAVSPEGVGKSAYWRIIRQIPEIDSAAAVFAKLRGVNIDEVSPVKTIKKMAETPVLLIHGKMDRLIPFNNSKEILKAMKDRPNSKLWLTEDAGHTESLSKYTVEYIYNLLSFLEANLS